MINYARTLLLNKHAQSRPPVGHDGEELIDPEYSTAVDPEPLKNIRTALFGLSPDYITENYRLMQFMRALEADYDAVRILKSIGEDKTTYKNRSALVIDPVVSMLQLAGDGALTVLGTYTGEDNIGRHSRIFQVILESSTAYDLTDYLTQQRTTGTYGSTITLGNTGVRVQPVGVTVYPSKWIINMIARPPKSLFEIMDNIDETDLQWLVKGDEEPWPTIRSMIQADRKSKRSVGILLGVIVKTHDILNK